MKAWRGVRKARPLDALELQEVAEPNPGPGEIRIRTRATACDLNQVDGCHGRYKTVDPPLPYTLGMEAVGFVDAVAQGLEAWMGRRVMLTGTGATGAHAESVVGQVDLAFECPESLDDTQAAAFYFPFHVAGLSLLERGRLVSGETVLVHGGAGGVGSATIQLAVAEGARVIATAGRPEKLARCRELGADVAINDREGAFAEAVLDATEKCGVDVVCDLIGGDVTRESLKCLAYGERLMLTGFSGGIEAEEEAGLLPRPIIFGNASVAGVLMAYGDPDLLKGEPGSISFRVCAHSNSNRDSRDISPRGESSRSWVAARASGIYRRNSSGWNAARRWGERFSIGRETEPDACGLRVARSIASMDLRPASARYSPARLLAFLCA